MDFDKTMQFKVEYQSGAEPKQILQDVYDALNEKGYDPINQIIGYFLSGDPTYITSFKDARSKIIQLERDELLEAILIEYLGINK